MYPLRKIINYISETFLQEPAIPKFKQEVSSALAHHWLGFENGAIDTTLLQFCSKLIKPTGSAVNPNMYFYLQGRVNDYCCGQLLDAFPNITDMVVFEKALTMAGAQVMPHVYTMLTTHNSTHWDAIYLTLSIQQLAFLATANASAWVVKHHAIDVQDNFMVIQQLRHDVFGSMGHLVKFAAESNLPGASFVPKGINGVPVIGVRPDYYIPGSLYVPTFVNGVPLGGIVPKINEGHPNWVQVHSLLEHSLDKQGALFRTGVDLRWISEKEDYNNGYNTWRQSITRTDSPVLSSAEVEQEKAREYRNFLCLSVGIVAGMVLAAKH